MYSNLRDFLASPQNSTVKAGIINFIEDYGAEDVIEELWNTYNNKLLGIDSPDAENGIDRYWQIDLDLGDAKIYLYRLEVKIDSTLSEVGYRSQIQNNLDAHSEVSWEYDAGNSTDLNNEAVKTYFAGVLLSFFNKYIEL